MNTEGMINSFFRVPQQIRGLWQYLEGITARKADKGSSPRMEPSMEWLMEVKHSSKAI